MALIDGQNSDPTALTSQAILREIENLEKLLTSRIGSIEEAVKVAHENLVRVPTDVDKAIGHLKGIVDERGGAVSERFSTMIEKFENVQSQFGQRDVAVGAALQAAEKAVAAQNANFNQTITKSESATIKLIDAQGEKITALTDRMNLEQGRHSGVTAGMGYVITGVGLMTTFLGAVATFLVLKGTDPTVMAAAPAAPAQAVPPQIIYVPIPPPTK